MKKGIGKDKDLEKLARKIQRQLREVRKDEDIRINLLGIVENAGETIPEARFKQGTLYNWIRGNEITQSKLEEWETRAKGGETIKRSEIIKFFNQTDEK